MKIWDRPSTQFKQKDRTLLSQTGRHIHKDAFLKFINRGVIFTKTQSLAGQTFTLHVLHNDSQHWNILPLIKTNSRNKKNYDHEFSTLCGESLMFINEGSHFRAVQCFIIYEPFTQSCTCVVLLQLLYLQLMECTSPKRQKEQVQGNLKGRLKFNPSKVIFHCQSLFLKLMNHYLQLPNLTDSNIGQLVWWKVSFCCKTKPYLTMNSCWVSYILYWFQTVLEQYI